MTLWLAAAGLVSALAVPPAEAGKVEYAAEFVSTRVDLSMSPGEQYQVRSLVKNLGSRTWRRGEVTLVAKWVGAATVTTGGFEAPLPRDADFNSTVTFEGQVTAPPYPGGWILSLQVMRGTTAIKDREDVKVNILTNFNAEISRTTFPSPMDVNRNYTCSVTVKNTGQSVWEARRLELVLNVTSPSGSARSKLLGKDKMAYPIIKAVKPGETYSFRITINPKLEGQYAVQVLVWDTEEADEVGKTDQVIVRVR